jgi:hypothetical protein
MRHVGVTHGRQFTGGVFAGASMRACAVGDDLSILVRQQLRSEFFDLFRGDVQRSGKVGFAVAFRRKRLYDLDGVIVPFPKGEENSSEDCCCKQAWLLKDS